MEKKKVKVSVNMESFYNGFMEAARAKDLNLGSIEIEGEILCEKGEPKYKIGQFVQIDTHSDVFGNEGRLGYIVRLPSDNNSHTYGIAFSRNRENKHMTPYREEALKLDMAASERNFFKGFGWE